MISPFHIHWDRSQGGILLVPESPEQSAAQTALHIDGWEFAGKHELHVTLLGRKMFKRLQTAGLEVEALGSMLDGMPTSWPVHSQGDFALLADPSWCAPDSGPIAAGRASIVEWVGLPLGDSLYQQISQVLRLRVHPPPFHITRWTAGDPQGIALNNERDLECLLQRDLARSELALG